MKPVSIILIVVFVLFCLGALAGVLYGVLRHDEPTFDPESDVVWASTPVNVCLAPDNIDYYPRLNAAASAINTAVHGELLHVHEDRPSDRCDIIVIYEMGAELSDPMPGAWRDPAGSAFVGRMSGRPLCDVWIGNVSGELEHLVVQHELGHCLGLTHDDWEGSIMYTSLEETPSGEFPPRLTDADREALRRRYFR